MPARVVKNQPLSDHPEERSEATRLAGRALLLARGLWITLFVLTLSLDVIGIPVTYLLAQRGCDGAACVPIQPTEEQVRAVVAAGIPLSFWAGHYVVLSTVATLVYVTVGIIIFRGRPDDRMALFGSIMLVTFGGAAFTGTMQALPGIHRAWFLPVTALNIVGQITFFMFFCLFPNGRFVPRWTRWTSLLWAATWVVALFPRLDLSLAPIIDGPLFVVLVSSLVVAQVYRYRWVSTPLHRRQTKWVVFGFSVGVGTFAAILVASEFVNDGLAYNPIVELVTTTVVYLCLLCVPIAIGIAILRSGLYDIDRIINRTLVYGTLTALLAAIYFGIVIVLQPVVRLLVSDTQNQLITVGSTLVIAGLFSPLRRRVQALIDRRFYRRRYDAANALQAFSARLRDEVDLPLLANDLLAVVEETMQPAHVSLWLRARPTGQQAQGEASTPPGH